MSESESRTDRVHDRERLAEIDRLGLLSDDAEAVLQDLVDEAARKFGLPTSLVSVVLDDAQQFAASKGLTAWLAEIKGTPIEWSFCATSVETGEPFVVEDATTHERVKENPLVEHDGFRCYAGVPLITSTGHPVGSLCVIGTAPRQFDEQELALLRELADEAIARIEKRMKSKT